MQPTEAEAKTKRNAAHPGSWLEEHVSRMPFLLPPRWGASGSAHTCVRASTATCYQSLMHVLAAAVPLLRPHALACSPGSFFAVLSSVLLVPFLTLNYAFL